MRTKSTIVFDYLQVEQDATPPELDPEVLERRE